jgi:tetratricopeptide (TPR) repeat protein
LIQRLKHIFNEHFVLMIALCLGLIVYFKFLYYGHISWDDPEMVFRNKAVMHFDVKTLLNGHFVGNYIPLTMFFHALTWLFFEGNDGAHHLVNILFHLLNGILVYKIVLGLMKNKEAANFCAIVFLLHPLQIESVGWISELKNCISGTAFFLAMLSYLNYAEKGRQKYYLQTLLFFVLACLAKSSAVILPLVLFSIDIFRTKDIKANFLVNKIPLFIGSLIFGIVNIKTQTADQFINYSHAFPFHERIGNAGNAILQYFGKFIFPVKLSVLYPFPEQNTGKMIVGLFCVLAILAALFSLYRKKKFELFALLLMILSSLILVLQFVPFGECLIADRYMYVAVLFFALFFFHLLQQTKQKLKFFSFFLLLLLSTLTFFRIKTWESTVKLYGDILEKYPDSFVALNSLGVELMMRNDDRQALEYLNRAAKAAPRNYKSFYNRGLLLLKMERPKDAISSFNESLNLFEYNKSYVGRGAAYYMLKDLPKAMNDAEHVLRKDPSQAKAWFVLGNCYNEMNKIDDAIRSYDKSLAINNDDPDFYFKRAIAYGKKQDFKPCLNDLNTVIDLNAGYMEAYYWRGVAKANLKLSPCEDLKIAARNNIPQAFNAYSKYCQ